MSGFSLYGNERSDITHAAGAVAKDIFLPRSCRYYHMIYGQVIYHNMIKRAFLGPRGPLGLLSLVRPSVRPQEKSGSAV